MRAAPTCGSDAFPGSRWRVDKEKTCAISQKNYVCAPALVQESDPEHIQSAAWIFKDPLHYSWGLPALIPLKWFNSRPVILRWCDSHRHLRNNCINLLPRTAAALGFQEHVINHTTFTSQQCVLKGLKIMREIMGSGSRCFVFGIFSLVSRD